MAHVYRRGDTYYLEASSKTTVGVWVSGDEVEVLPITASDSELGAAIARRLEHSMRGVPHPTDWKAVVAPLLKASKTRSFSAFARDAQLVSIEERDGPVTVTPTTNGGPRSGFSDLTDRAVTIESTDLERIGATVRELLANA